MPTSASASAARSVARALVAVLAVAFVACYTDDETTAPGLVNLTLDTAPIDLGVRDAATGTTPSRTITLRNTGDASTGTITVRYDAGATAGLTVSTATTGSCGAHPLAAGGSCTITVSLGGQASGPQFGVLRVETAGNAVALFSIPVGGTIRSALSILQQGVGHGTVTATSTSGTPGCIGATNCSVAGQSAVCTATCGVSIDAPTVTLVAAPDASSTFDGFVRATGESPCAPTGGTTCTLSLIDLNSVSVRFTPK